MYLECAWSVDKIAIDEHLVGGSSFGGKTATESMLHAGLQEKICVNVEALQNVEIDEQ